MKNRRINTTKFAVLLSITTMAAAIVGCEKSNQSSDMREKKQKRYIKKMKTVCLAGLLVTAQCAGMILPVMAAPAEVAGQEIGLQTEIPLTVEQMDETNLIPSHVRDIFDAEFYRNTYPDVAAAFGDDEQALFKHFMMFGLK